MGAVLGGSSQVKVSLSGAKVESKQCHKQRAGGIGMGISQPAEEYLYCFIFILIFFFFCFLLRLIFAFNFCWWQLLLYFVPLLF